MPSHGRRVMILLVQRIADDAIRAPPGMAAIDGLLPLRLIRANRQQPLWDNVDPDTWLP